MVDVVVEYGCLFFASAYEKAALKRKEQEERA